MTFDDLRAKFPALGFGAYALTPGGPVTFEVYSPDGDVWTWTAATLTAAIEQAFPATPAPVSEPEPEPSIFD